MSLPDRTASKLATVQTRHSGPRFFGHLRLRIQKADCKPETLLNLFKKIHIFIGGGVSRRGGGFIAMSWRKTPYPSEKPPLCPNVPIWKKMVI